ncbi:eukaryotic translation initiation factor 2 beta [Punctularia strigosozonata HHB-11173 SS5]|uniref:eukaryotic translation initiation factor 2 beta n=1 Tax=Punctularia strigosozonata (strain HHB-11173) TaxID=741275 RepID=UPI0004417382|nr:eukaryotic translation initiation factor 2 beta [Punctularia strigosozonata HHB-11173 SS5]EIN14467.1 eukaryotic translation initiation factor 2 beta [Punctularia strigosozonata HHB-11173 SS5]
MSEEPLFDPSLKKRKKKTVAFNEDPLAAEADPTTPAPSIIDTRTLNGETVDMGPTTAHEQMKQAAGGEVSETPKEDDEFKAMFGDLKKKKKKKDIPLDLDGEGSGISTPAKDAAATEDLDFSDLKKKKKSSKKKAAFDMEAFEKELEETKAKEEEEDGVDNDGTHLDDVDEGELGDDPFARGDAPAGVDGSDEPWLKSDRDYTYPELLHRFYACLHAANPALLTSSGKRYTIAPPSLAREGNKKTIFTNISEICKRMHRQPEHVIQFMFAEMGTTGSVDGSSRLVIKGRFQQKQIEHVLRRYIVEYVTCKTCKSPDTLLTKENRIFFMSCESCGSRRSVNAIKSGFQAQVGKRKKTG